MLYYNNAYLYGSVRPIDHFQNETENFRGLRLRSVCSSVVRTNVSANRLEMAENVDGFGPQ